jgi:hypothetical protein
LIQAIIRLLVGLMLDFSQVPPFAHQCHPLPHHLLAVVWVVVEVEVEGEQMEEKVEVREDWLFVVGLAQSKHLRMDRHQ